MREILVSDIMTRDAVFVNPKTDLLECARKMVKEKVSSVLIIDGKKLVGFINQKDILWALVKTSKADLSKITAMEISPRKIAVIKPTATLKETIEKMKKLKFERLPVIHEGVLVGMITARDILTFHPELYPELEELASIREEEKKLKRVKMAKTTNKLTEGMCEECGSPDFLERVNGMLICDSCRSSM